MIYLRTEVDEGACSLCNGTGCRSCRGSGASSRLIDVWTCSVCKHEGEGKVGEECPACGAEDGITDERDESASDGEPDWEGIAEDIASEGEYTGP